MMLKDGWSSPSFTRHLRVDECTTAICGVHINHDTDPYWHHSATRKKLCPKCRDIAVTMPVSVSIKFQVATSAYGRPLRRTDESDQTAYLRGNFYWKSDYFASSDNWYRVIRETHIQPIEEVIFDA